MPKAPVLISKTSPRMPSESSSGATSGLVRKRTIPSAQFGSVVITCAVGCPIALSSAASSATCAFGEAEPDGLVGAEGEQLALLDHARNLHVLIDHRLGQPRIEPTLLGQRPELRPHGRHHLLGGLGPLPVNRCGGPDDRPGPHVDAVGGDGDEGAGAVRPRIHEGVDRDPGVPDGIGDTLRRVDPAAWGIDIEKRRRGPG